MCYFLVYLHIYETHVHNFTGTFIFGIPHPRFCDRHIFSLFRTKHLELAQFLLFCNGTFTTACIPHDLIIAKLAAYGNERKSLRLIYSYLKGQKQCVKINNIYSDYNEIISGVPQGSILGPNLFNLSINDSFFFIEVASMHNFADDNTYLPGEKQFPN